MLLGILTHSFFYYPMFLLFLCFMLLIHKNGWEETLPKASFITFFAVIALSIGVISEETQNLKKEIVLNKPIECQGKIIEAYTVKDNLIVADVMAYSISWPECKKIKKEK